MMRIDALTQRIALAMAGKNPWGDKDGGSDGDKGQSDGKPKGPKNPWLPSGGGEGDEPRRAPNIEDIFKNRGPEGPRRGGGGGDGPNFRLPERPGGKSWFPVAVVAIVVVGMLVSMLHFVGPKEKAVVKTLGNYSRTLDAGLNFSLPWPIETVDVVDIGVRAVQIPSAGEGEKLILTGDQNLVDVTYIIRWNVKNPANFQFSLAEPEVTVNEAAEAAMRASVAEKTLEDTFSGQGRAEIEQAVLDRMQKTLNNYNAGVNVIGVEIDKADPPGKVQAAFHKVKVAEQNAEADRNQARGYAQQVLARAQGESQAFDKIYEQYRLAPRVTRQRLYYETMERVLRDNDKTIIEARGVTPYLPLPEIKRRSSPSIPAPPASSSTSAKTGAKPEAKTGSGTALKLSNSSTSAKPAGE